MGCRNQSRCLLQYRSSMFSETQAYGTTDDDNDIVGLTSRGLIYITLPRFVDTCSRELSRLVGMSITQHKNRCGQCALAPCSSAYAVCMGNQLASKSTQVDLDSHVSTVRGSTGVCSLWRRMVFQMTLQRSSENVEREREKRTVEPVAPLAFRLRLKKKCFNH